MCTNFFMVKCLRQTRICYQKFGIKHILLWLLFSIYIFLGGVLFFLLEFEEEEAQVEKWQSDMIKNRTDFLNRTFVVDILNNTNYYLYINYERSQRLMIRLHQAMIEYENGLGIQFRPYGYNWTFPNSVMYASTIVTTIGYGHLRPATAPGKIASIVYAIFGIPLCILMVQDLSYFITIFLACPSMLIKSICRCIKFFASKGTTQDDLSPPLLENSSNASSENNGANRQTNRGRKSKTGCYPCRSKRSRSRTQNRYSNKNLVSSISTSFAVIVLVGWLILGSFLFYIIEEPKWDFLTSVYFFFHTISTVGNGDIVPSKPFYLLIMLLFVLVSLALVSTFVHLVHSKLLHVYHKQNRKPTRYRGGATSTAPRARIGEELVSDSSPGFINDTFNETASDIDLASCVTLGVWHVASKTNSPRTPPGLVPGKVATSRKESKHVQTYISMYQNDMSTQKEFDIDNSSGCRVIITPQSEHSLDDVSKLVSTEKYNDLGLKYPAPKAKEENVYVFEREFDDVTAEKPDVKILQEPVTTTMSDQNPELKSPCKQTTQRPRSCSNGNIAPH